MYLEVTKIGDFYTYFENNLMKVEPGMGYLLPRLVCLRQNLLIISDQHYYLIVLMTPSIDKK